VNAFSPNDLVSIYSSPPPHKNAGDLIALAMALVQRARTMISVDLHDHLLRIGNRRIKARTVEPRFLTSLPFNRSPLISYPDEATRHEASVQPFESHTQDAAQIIACQALVCNRRQVASGRQGRGRVASGTPGTIHDLRIASFASPGKRRLN
jgi:hypothetical protein